MSVVEDYSIAVRHLPVLCYFDPRCGCTKNLSKLVRCLEKCCICHIIVDSSNILIRRINNYVRYTDNGVFVQQVLKTSDETILQQQLPWSDYVIERNLCSSNCRKRQGQHKDKERVVRASMCETYAAWTECLHLPLGHITAYLVCFVVLALHINGTVSPCYIWEMSGLCFVSHQYLKKRMTRWRVWTDVSKYRVGIKVHPLICFFIQNFFHLYFSGSDAPPLIDLFVLLQCII